MQGSHPGYQIWAIAIYAITTNLKGISAIKLHRGLEISYRPAWRLMHRLRKAYETGQDIFAGPIEVDGTFVGGKRKNMSKKKRKELTALGTVGKTAVVGVKDRDTNAVTAKVVKETDKKTLQGFVRKNTEPKARIYTGEARRCQNMAGFDHEAVNHSVGGYVHKQAHTNGIESFWATLKRAYHGTCHKISPKHLDRCVTEFASRHNDRDADTIDMMGTVACGMKGKRLKY